MASNWAGRCLLSGLHLCAGIAACGSLVAMLLQWAENLNCLAPVTDGYGDPVFVKNALGVACDVITYSSWALCGLNLLMAVTLSSCLRSWCCLFLHQLVTMIMGVVAMGSSTTLTVDFILWCHSLQNNLAVYNGCEEAAKEYDVQHKTSNMTSYFKKMQMQQASLWAAVPILLCAVIVYSVVMKTEAQPRRESGRYYTLDEDESAPLIQPEMSPAGTSTNPRGRANIATPGTSVD